MNYLSEEIYRFLIGKKLKCLDEKILKRIYKLIIKHQKLDGISHTKNDISKK